MSRVLLTGANGYLGRSLQSVLVDKGFEVHALSRGAMPAGDGINWHQVDLLNAVEAATAIRKISATHLVHLAWVTEPGKYWQSPDNARWLDASIALLEEFTANGGERAVLAGTCAEYDWSEGLCSEQSTPLRAQSPYTSAKLAFREAARDFASNSELTFAWARVFFSFGPHEHPQRLIAAVILALLNGERAACSDGLQRRDFMYVRDLADAFAAVLVSDFAGDINVASGGTMSLKELVSQVADKMQALDRVDFGARERLEGEPAVISADISRLRDQIGWTPKYDIEAAIDETIAWWKQQGSTT